MPKLTVHDAETAAAPEGAAAGLIRDATAPEDVTDARGRKLTIRKPGPLAQYRLVKNVGPEAAANQTYMQMIQPLIYLAAIDGDPVHLPASDREVEALIQRLDDDGLTALMSWYMVHVIQPMQDAIEAAKRDAEIKN